MSEPSRDPKSPTPTDPEASAPTEDERMLQDLVEITQDQMQQVRDRLAAYVRAERALGRRPRHRRAGPLGKHPKYRRG